MSEISRGQAPDMSKITDTADEAIADIDEALAEYYATVPHPDTDVFLPEAWDHPAPDMNTLPNSGGVLSSLHEAGDTAEGFNPFRQFGTRITRVLGTGRTESYDEELFEPGEIEQPMFYPGEAGSEE